MAEEKKKCNKLVIFFSILFFLFFIFGILLLIYAPIIKDKIERDKLKNEIANVLKDYDNGKDVESIKTLLKKDLTTGKRKKLELKIEDYLIFIMDKKEELNEICNDEKIKYSLNIRTIDDNTILDSYSSNKEKLLVIKDELNTYKEKNKIYNSKDDNLSSLYSNLTNKINETISFDDIDNMIDYLDKTTPIVKYLKDNRNFYDIKEDKIEFKKRAKKEAYDKLINETEFNKDLVSPTTLIEDKTGPVITANNITITKGTYVNVKEKVKCFDEVDDDVECIINGTYNKDKAGEYSIKITSKDKSGNSSSKDIKVYVKERVSVSNRPYYIEVIRNQNTVIVYGKDGNGNYTNRVKVFPCSVGRNNWTPTGTFSTSKGNDWGFLFGGVYGQYSTRITGNILFHSVPYTALRRNALEWEEYNKLGTAASAGCVRLTVRDAKWIYDNVASGTTVKIYDGNLPSGVSKPYAQKIPANSPNRGWDPTDPHPDNPWRK